MKLHFDAGKESTVLPRILRAAVKLFVEKGIDGTTTRDIAAAAKVAEGALYRHFKSKTALAWHIFTVHVNRFALDLSARVAAAPGARDKIRAYVAACFEAFEADRLLFTYLIVSEHRELAQFPATHVHPGHVAVQLIEEGQKGGELRPMDPVVGAALLFGAVHRLCLVRTYGTIRGDLRSRVDAVARSLWDGLKVTK